MGKLSHLHCFSMQAEQVQGPPDGLPGGSTSYEAWTQADAAALCAGLRRKYWLAGRLRWGMDKTVAMELEHYLWGEVAQTAAREKWILAIGQETMRALAGLAIAEMLDPVRYRQEGFRVEWFGRRIKLSKERVFPAWERCWKWRYQGAAYAPLERWSDVCKSHIYHRQRENP